MQKSLRDLIEVMQFTEDVSAQIHGMLNERDIFQKIRKAFLESKRYNIGILLLTEDSSSLRIVTSSVPRDVIDVGEKTAGIKLTGADVDLSRSTILTQVVREGKTLQVQTMKVLGEMFAEPFASSIADSLGYQNKLGIVTPLKYHDKIIGVFGISSTALAENFVPSVRNLAQHISTALELAHEVAERRNVQDSLEQSEARWRSLAENAPSLIAIVDSDGMVVFANRAVPGVSLGDVVGGKIYDYMHPEYKATVKEVVNQVFQTGEYKSLELKAMGPEAQMDTWYELHVGPIIESGHVVAAHLIAHDITDRKKSEWEILERNRELAALNTVAQTVNQSLDLYEILNNALDKMLEILNVKHGAIALMDTDGEYLTVKINRGIPPDFVGPISPIRVGEGFIGRAALSAEPELIASLHESDRLIQESTARLVVDQQLTSLMTVPLTARGKILGVMAVMTQGQRVFTEEEKRLLVTIAHQISTAVENALLYEKLQLKEETRTEVLRQAIFAQEEGRRRIARELHDQTSQVLTGASAKIEASITALPDDAEEIKQRLKETRTSLTDILVDIRGIIHELRPPMLDDLGLVSAIEWHASEYLIKSGVLADFETYGRKKKLSPPVEMALFRIVQEASTNVVKHAEAASVSIRLEFKKGSVALSVEDDGNGFDTRKVSTRKNKRRGMGLLNMKERAELLHGDFAIKSRRGIGTRITVSIPTK